MVGHPKHVAKALQSGVDLICAQAGEAGGHTGDIPASLLVPTCADAIRGYKSPLTGKQVCLVGAGAIYDGRGLAANLAWGARAVWVGTLFWLVSKRVRRRRTRILSSRLDGKIPLARSFSLDVLQGYTRRCTFGTGK